MLTVAELSALTLDCWFMHKGQKRTLNLDGVTEEEERAQGAV